MAQIVRAIGALHEKNIVHRDLKTENILVMEDGFLKVIDYGLAADTTQGNEVRGLKGTLEYIAPEVWEGGTYDKTVDWWAIGIMIFELLTGKTPFVGASEAKIKKNVLANEVSFPSNFDNNAKKLVTALL